MRTWLVLSLCLGTGLATIHCSGSQQQQEDDEVVGTPPSEERDPFDVVNMPDSAKRAAKSGVIGPDDEEGSDIEQGQKSLEKLTARTDDASPDESNSPQSGAEDYQCFACVKICAESKGASCDPSSEDVICGWGVHPKRETAREAARAQCGGALDMMRETSRWGAIKGTCPEATCQTSSPSSSTL